MFETTNPLTLTNGVGALEALGNFYRLTSIRDGNIFFESVTRKESRLFQLSPLASPTATRPVYMLDQVNNRVRVFGRTPLTVDVDYIRIPNLVNWTYVVVGGKALHNSTAGDIGHFELHPSEETDLVLKILTLAGFTLKDPGLYQAAASEDMKNTQQEKQ